MSVRCYMPGNGKLLEIDLDTAQRIAFGPRRKWRPAPIVVEKDRHYARVVLRAIRGEYLASLPTSQSRKLAEAAIAVSACHAIAAFGGAMDRAEAYAAHQARMEAMQ